MRQRLSELAFVLVPGGLQLFVGTPHAYDTIYNTAPGGYLEGFQRLFLPLLTDDGQSAWPERFSLAKIDEIRRRSGPRKFASQMMLAPVPCVENRLDPDRLTFYDTEIVYHETNSSASLSIGDVQMVSASAWWDPSFGKPDKGDASVLACVFTDKEGRAWLHAVEYLKVPAGAESAAFQCQAAAAFVQKYHLPSLALETNGIGKFCRNCCAGRFGFSVYRRPFCRATAPNLKPNAFWKLLTRDWPPVRCGYMNVSVQRRF